MSPVAAPSQHRPVWYRILAADRMELEYRIGVLVGQNGKSFAVFEISLKIGSMMAVVGGCVIT